MRPVTRAELLWTAVLGIVLVGSAFCLVDLHFQMRQLFVAHEHEMMFIADCSTTRPSWK